MCTLYVLQHQHNNVLCNKHFFKYIQVNLHVSTCIHKQRIKQNKYQIQWMYECTIYMICYVHVLQHKHSNVLCNIHFQVHTSQSSCVYMHPHTESKKKNKCQIQWMYVQCIIYDMLCTCTGSTNIWTIKLLQIQWMYMYVYVWVYDIHVQVPVYDVLCTCTPNIRTIKTLWYSIR